MRAWWLALHGLLGAAAVSLEAGVVSGAVVAACAVHGAARWPRIPPTVVYLGDGLWAVPAWRRWALALAPASTYSGHWARLVLCSGHDFSAAVLLLRDQLDDDAWWRLQSVLREAPGFPGFPRA
jgi:hypothetical protein